MFGKSITLFKMFGFAVRIDVSWLIIVALVVWSLAAGVFPAEYEGLHWSTYLIMALAGALGLFASIMIHEFAHSLVARRFGLPMKGITLFLFGGVAEMSDEPPCPKAEFLMAGVGPLTSLVIAAAFFGLSALGAQLVWPDTVVGVLRWIALINLILAIFNLIPGFPLDGGRMLRAIIWHVKHDLRTATHAASRVGAIFGAVLIGLGFLNLIAMNPIGGLWYILIGMFLRGAARQAYQQVLMRELLKGETVRRFMTGEPVTVPPSLTLDRLVEDYIYRHHHKMFPVADNGNLRGAVTTRDVRDVPKDAWSERTAGDIAREPSQANCIAADEDAMHALARMNQEQESRLMVVDEQNNLVGIVALKDLLRFLSLKLEFETDEAARVALPGGMPGERN